MSIKAPQPESPQEKNEQLKRVAQTNLELAGFKTGQQVNIPFEDQYPKGSWYILGATFMTAFGGRTIPAVEVQNENKSIITVPLQDLCAVNSVYKEYRDDLYETTLTKIGENLTKSKIIILDMEYLGRRQEIIMGIIKNQIKVGEEISSSIQPNSAKVTRITLRKNTYRIETDDGTVYYFNPDQSIDDKQD